MTQRNPLKEAGIEASKQQVRSPMEPFQVVVADPVPVWMDRIGITSVPRSGPGVQRPRSEDPSLGSEVHKRLTNMEDAF